MRVRVHTAGIFGFYNYWYFPILFHRLLFLPTVWV